MSYNNLKEVDLLVSSYAKTKIKEFLVVMYYGKESRLMRGYRENTSHTSIQLLGINTALACLKFPVNVTIYLNNHELHELLGVRLKGYMALGNIEKQAQKEMLKTYYRFLQIHHIELIN